MVAMVITIPHLIMTNYHTYSQYWHKYVGSQQKTTTSDRSQRNRKDKIPSLSGNYGLLAMVLLNDDISLVT